DDDLRHQIGGRNPTSFIDGGAERALDTGQRRIGDLDIEDRGEGAENGAENREPIAKTCTRRFGCRGNHRAIASAACAPAVSPPVLTVAATERPGRRRASKGSLASSAIRTGTR